MEDVSMGQLERVIAAQHGVASAFVKSVRVHRKIGQSDWDGMVHIFDLKGHALAKRYFAVLQGAQIATPVQAVKAASAAIRKWGAQGTR